MGARLLVDARLPWGSGIGRYVANTAPRVARRLPTSTFEVLVSPSDVERAKQAMADLPNARVLSTEVRPFSSAELWRLGALARDHDLTWFTNYWVPSTFRKPFVAAIHDMLHLEPALFPASSIKRAASRRAFAHVARRARGIFFGSRFTRREFERRFTTQARREVTGYGVDHEGFESFDPEAPPRKRRQLLLVAAAKRHKNFAVALEAFRRAALSETWHLIVVIPDDRLRSSIDVHALGGADRIEIRRGITDVELRSLYADSAILLMPSLYEGFGLPLAEGLQAGSQCVSSTAESLVELGQGARITFVNGLDIPGWVKAIEDECRRFDSGEVNVATTSANMRHAMRYDWDRVADGTAGLIADVLG